MKRLVTEGAAVANVPAQAPTEESARDRVRERRNVRKRHKVLKAVLVTLAVCGAIVGTYAAGFWYFRSHYYPGTQVAGVDAAGMTVEDLSHALDQQIESYVATVGNGSFELSFAGADVDLACDTQAFAERLMTFQDASSWPVGILGANARNERDIGITFDQQKLAALVGEAVTSYNEGARQPVAATLALNDAKDAFAVVPEKDGTALDASAVCATIEDALAYGQQEVELTSSDLVQPTFRAGDDATTQALDRANAALQLNIPLARGEEVVAHVGAVSFAPWLVVNDDLTLGVDGEAAADWAEEYLWQIVDYADDANAYSLDVAAFGEALVEPIQAAVDDPGKAATLPYATTPRYLPGNGSLNPTAWNAELGRYLDVDKKSQTACLYDETGRVLWETPVTTGNEAGGRGTPVGQFGIYDKKTDFMLIGYDEDNDGKPDYEHHVDFWMPFNEGIGLHDASWRKVYGGTEYLEHGSGGCVNLPHDAAAALYAITHENETVIVHE